jgi:hypothetical protein
MRYAFALKGGHDQPAMLAVFFKDEHVHVLSPCIESLFIFLWFLLQDSLEAIN